MSEVEKVENSFLKELNLIEEVGLYALKGYSNKDIAELCEISPYKVKQYIEKYNELIQDRADKDPYFLEKIQFNVLKALAAYDEISKQVWETISVATDEGMIPQRLAGLKLALEVEAKKSQIMQLGGVKSADAEYLARTQKAETVNNLISRVIRDVVSNCPKCAEQARVLLAEAFSLMDEEPAVMVENENG